MYGNLVYIPYPITIDQVKETSKPERKTFTIAVSNYDGLVANYLEQGKLRGRKVLMTTALLKHD